MLRALSDLVNSVGCHCILSFQSVSGALSGVANCMSRRFISLCQSIVMLTVVSDILGRAVSIPRKSE